MLLLKLVVRVDHVLCSEHIVVVQVAFMSQIKFVPISSFSEATAEIALSLKQQYQQLSGNTPGKYNPVAYALEVHQD